MSIGAGFGNRNSDRDDRSCPQKKRFVLGARGGHVACATAVRDGATLNALVERFTQEEHGRASRRFRAR